MSGGGNRAAAFSYGVLLELRDAGTGATPTGLADNIHFLTAVSGGAVTAAWFAMTGPSGLDSFRERYLLTDSERYMVPNSFDPGNLAESIGQGLNGRDTFARALDESLFRGSRFADLAWLGNVRLSLVASDVASASPFVFDPLTFDALCSALPRVPLAEAVAASAAVPIIFAPTVIEVHQRSCVFHEPHDLRMARLDDGADPALRLLAESIARYADGAQVQSVRLLDGGMTDIFGSSGLLLARAQGGVAPMTQEQAVRVRHMLFVAVDSTKDNSALTDQLLPLGRLLGLSVFGVSQRLRDAGGGDLDMLLAGRGIRATTTRSFATLRLVTMDWQRAIIDWRCALDVASLDQLYPDRPTGWNCNDLRLYMDEVSFADLPQRLRDTLNDVPSRLSLPVGTTDTVIDAGRRALRATPAYRSFLANIATAP